MKIGLFNIIRNNSNEKILFVCHSTYVEGGKVFDPNWSITFGFLDHYFGKDYSVLRHSLYKGGETRLYGKGVHGPFNTLPLVGKLPDPLRYIAEIFATFAALIHVRPTTVIAIDPLSAFVPVMLKRLGLIKKVFFITPDYTKRRFENDLLNSIYFYIDKMATKYSTKNIICSEWVMQYKKELYPTLKHEEQFFHFPNIPNPWVVDKLAHIQKIKNKVIYVGSVTDQIDFEVIAKELKPFADKHPEFQFSIAGSGDRLDSLKECVQRENLSFVKILGQLTYGDTLKEIASSEIGIAFYNGALHYDEFRDSCKIREYQAFGCIPIVSRVVKSNADEIERMSSGVILDRVEDIPAAISKIGEDEAYKMKLTSAAHQNYRMYIHIYEELYKIIIG